MADLIDRISGECRLADPPRPKINLHRFIALERLYVLGVWSRAQIAVALDFQGDEATQGSQLADAIDGQSNLTNRVLYLMRVESVCMCVEDNEDTFYHSGGVVNKPQVYADLQIAG